MIRLYLVFLALCLMNWLMLASEHGFDLAGFAMMLTMFFVISFLFTVFRIIYLGDQMVNACLTDMERFE